jgi:hypothetical protein
VIFHGTVIPRDAGKLTRPRFGFPTVGKPARMGLDRSLDQEGIPDIPGPLPEQAATGDPPEGASQPSERPAAEGYGVTGEEGARQEPLERRIARELPEVDKGNFRKRRKGWCSSIRPMRASTPASTMRTMRRTRSPAASIPAG